MIIHRAQFDELKSKAATKDLNVQTQIKKQSKVHMEKIVKARAGNLTVQAAVKRQKEVSGSSITKNNAKAIADSPAVLAHFASMSEHSKRQLEQKKH